MGATPTRAGPSAPPGTPARPLALREHPFAAGRASAHRPPGEEARSGLLQPSVQQGCAPSGPTPPNADTEEGSFPPPNRHGNWAAQEAARQLAGAAGSEKGKGKKLGLTRLPERELGRRWPVEPRGAGDGSVASTRSDGPACGRVGATASEAVWPEGANVATESRKESKPAAPGKRSAESAWRLSPVCATLCFVSTRPARPGAGLLGARQVGPRTKLCGPQSLGSPRQSQAKEATL